MAMGGWFSPSRVLFQAGPSWEFLLIAAERGTDAMQINGLLVTLAAQSRTKCEAVARQLAGRAELSIGELNDRWLPVAMEAADDAHARELHDWIGAQPGVEFVDVVSVSFDDSECGCAESQPQLVGSSKPMRLPEDDMPKLQPVPFSALND